MNTRVLRTELKRSVAPWAGAVALLGGPAFLYSLDGPWWKGTELWIAQWTSMAMWTRSMLVFLWPLAVGLGALQGLRDHRSKMPELLTSTPRPAWHRAATLSGSTALTLASGFGLFVLVGAVQVLFRAEYQHLGWLPISLVAGLSLVAGAVLGMGVGRALPSALTPPALAVAALFVTAVLRMTLDTALPSSSLPVPVALLSPSVEGVRQVLITFSASVHVGQTLWLLGMAATGFALLAAATPKARTLALTPLLSGAAVALLVLPATPRETYVIDEDAAAEVCDGRVCVTKAHEGELSYLAGPGEKALRLLRESLGAGAPTAIRETTALNSPLKPMERSRTHVIVDFADEAVSGARGEELTRVLVGLGVAPTCSPRSWGSSGTDSEAAAQSVAAGWVFGDLRPIDGTMHSAAFQMEKARPAWKKLKALPRAEQRSRVKAMRAAALSCDGEPLEAVTGGGSR
ncbi:hypothetical protein H181DRAFT_01865 [Streptomyces sp. WMMB 714]|uniref:hypothetical protein n=1 Tax=Streptomyces sp. WMMB 714 TaxID=1286822 RepID=UPI0005F84701|nr:hypothetical protein [Streptomyces sp. WMMB 714]SCK24570.1 hypothetical protein H181DRAFT_01865 [Streptomyces sp. WMMB 714]